MSSPFCHPLIWHIGFSPLQSSFCSRHSYKRPLVALGTSGWLIPSGVGVRLLTFKAVFQEQGSPERRAAPLDLRPCLHKRSFRDATRISCRASHCCRHGTVLCPEWPGAASLREHLWSLTNRTLPSLSLSVEERLDLSALTTPPPLLLLRGCHKEWYETSREGWSQRNALHLIHPAINTQPPLLPFIPSNTAGLCWNV